MQSLLKKQVVTVCSSRFDFQWKIVDYYPEVIKSPDFCHPLFCNDVWCVQLDPPPSQFTVSKTRIKLIPKEVSTTERIGVIFYWDERDKLRSTMHLPSNGEIVAEKDVLDGYEGMVGSNFTIKISLLYPKESLPSPSRDKLVDEVTHLLKDQSFLQDVSSRDFTLISMDGKSSIKIHSLLLSAKSSVMRAMLRMESSKENKSRTIMFKETPFHVLERFVEYVYSDNIDFSRLDMRQAIDLFLFADQYDIPGLKYFMEAFISCNINSEFCAQLVKEVISKIDSTVIERALNRFYSSLDSLPSS